jgi:hypothetical protein
MYGIFKLRIFTVCLHIKWSDIKQPLEYLVSFSILRTCTSEKRAFLEAKFPTLCKNLAKVAKQVETQTRIRLCHDYRWEPRRWGMNMTGDFFDCCKHAEWDFIFIHSEIVAMLWYYRKLHVTFIKLLYPGKKLKRRVKSLGCQAGQYLKSVT